MKPRARIRQALAPALALILVAFSAQAAPVYHFDKVVNGLQVDQYVWYDSLGRVRSVALKKQGAGNPGNGGYAIQMTYQVDVGGGVLASIVANATPTGDGGFGYFVAHEPYRTFTDGSQDTIAHRIFGASDSPLGLAFPVISQRLATGNLAIAVHRFTQYYPRHGTLNAVPKNAEGEDSIPIPIDPSLHRRYMVPVYTSWIFEDGKDFPRIQTRIALRAVVGPDRVNFDVRGPYGVLNFDNGRNSTIDWAMWGDRFHFINTAKPLTRNRGWVWSQRNLGGRYNALIAGAFEMGLFEPRRFTNTVLRDGFAFGRGLTSAAYTCDDPVQVLPCDWEWPYQSAQYSLPYDDLNAPTIFEKIAWGSAPYYGAGPSLTVVYESPTQATPFVGYPAGGVITYDLCVVLGRTIAGGLTRRAAAGPTYSCPTYGMP